MNIMACTPDYGISTDTIRDNVTYNFSASDTTSNITAPDAAYNFSFFSDYDIAQLAWFIKAESIIDVYITRWICAFGILGNIINLLILTRRSVSAHMSELEKSLHVGLIALAMSDLLYCICSFPEAIKAYKRYNGPGMNFWVMYDAYGYAFINCFLLSSSWLIVAMAVCRYLIAYHPLRAHHYLSTAVSRTIIITVFCLSILFSLPRFWMQKIESVPCEEGGRLYFVMNAYMKRNETARLLYMWLNFILGILSPLLVLMYCNVFLVKALVASSTSRQQHASPKGRETMYVATLTLCIIVILYIVLVGPAELVTFWAPFVSHGNAVRYGLAVKICNTLQMLNFAINFLLYCVVNTHFRNVVKSIVCCWHPKSQAVFHASVLENGTTVETTIMLEHTALHSPQRVPISEEKSRESISL